MRISARSDYACRALLELALHWPNKAPMQIGDIAKRGNIPTKYLVHILIHLKQMGLVKSTRGKEGGYILSKSPGEIVFGKFIRQIGGPFVPVAISKKGADKLNVFSPIWHDVESAISEVVDDITFQDLVEKARGLSEVLVYQI
ncbi:MAG: Rrf2 family transcriptional regulator [Candidatus Omnitrophica bacterium]|nr:Rrf2 family transcriptional regulator [Candidatus Omnitrophota bacterium]